MKTLFISDIHLETTNSSLTKMFLRFLQTEATTAQALYLLGDLFESYIGDDENSLLHQEVAAALAKLVARGIAVSLLNGNRDFLVGKQFAQRCGATLLREPFVIDLYGVPTLLLHGDSLCTQDKAYQRLRWILRHPLVQFLGLKLPLSLRLRVAEKLRAESQYATQSKSLMIMDVVQEAVEAALRENHVYRLIHGHTHRPAVHRFMVDGQRAERFVLGAWDVRAEYLEATPELVRLVKFSR